MKVKYFAVLAIVTVLSLGTLASCSSSNDSSSNAAKTGNASNATDVQANPCASKTNPCAAKSNPCASKTNPCASKTNPCAAKAQSVGGPLATELQGKPVVVDVFASWCSACKNVAPTLTQLKKDYAGKATFVVLDVSDKSTTTAAEAKATQLGLDQFLAMNKAQTGLIAIVDPATGKILAQHRNNTNLADYKAVLDTTSVQ
jgi:thiol-disulfide isomerase/thioredoxin